MALLLEVGDVLLLLDDPAGQDAGLRVREDLED
jgi:hypothetical protein